MAPPFVQETPVWIYTIVGVLTALVAVASAYIVYLHRVKLDQGQKQSSSDSSSDDSEGLRIDNIGLSKKAEDLLNQILENPELQNELPGKLDVSKATVSNAVSELKDRGLIIRKKKANTYLIEPDREELGKQQR
ncbi:MAG: biotin operon repressor [Candidatus Nanohaloarchaea archaeon]|jgi:biotin operon repressor